MKLIKRNFLKCKFICFLVFAVLFFFAAQNAVAGDCTFVNFSEKTGSAYIYYSEHIASKYDQSWENFLCKNGEDWSMESQVYSINKNENGDFQITGKTLIINNSVIAGFTGGSFINVKDVSGENIYLCSTKSGLPIGVIDISEDQALLVGWGVNPGKAEVYVAGYKTQKIAWWKVRIPILKIRIVPNVRSVNWEIEIPSYVAGRELFAEVLNVHTPTNRVVKSLEEAGNKTLSFAVQCGLPTALLYVKISNGVFTFYDFQSYFSSVLRWAVSENLLNSSKGQNVLNILQAVSELVNTYQFGLNISSQKNLLKMGFDLVTMISDNSFNVQSLTSFISSLQSLSANGGILKNTTKQTVVILENLRPLLKLSAKQDEIYSTVLSSVVLIDNIGNSLTGKLGTALNGFGLVFDIYEKVKYGEITGDNAAVLINDWFDKIGLIVKENAPQYYDEFRAYKNTAALLLAKLIVIADEQNWI